MTNLEARTIGRFQFEDQLGQGSFSTVWRAYDPNLDRDVAIKIPRMDINERTKETFLREGQRIAQLRHEGIVQVFEADVDAHSSTPYIVLELVEGVTLGEWCSFVGITPHEAAKILLKIAQAVHHAHQQGIIHRDLKPANVLVSLSGAIQVTDFGLSKSIGVDSSAGTARIGTLAYMSPEQAGLLPFDISPASDIFALGVILFELLTGNNPIQAESPPEHLAKLATGSRQNLRSSTKDIPHDLIVICEKAIAHRPVDRFQTAEQFADELERFLNGTPIKSRSPSRAKQLLRDFKLHPLNWMLAAVGLVFVLAGLMVFVQVSRKSEADRIALREIAVSNLLSCQPSGVPLAIDDLFPFLHEVEPQLEKLCQSQNLSDRLRSLIALTAIGRPVVDQLIATVPHCEINESRNLIEAFVRMRATSIKSLQSEFEREFQNSNQSREWKKTSRLAIILAHAGDLQGVSQMSQLDGKPEHRTALATEWRNFHGSPTDFMQWLRSDLPPSLAGLILEVLGQLRDWKPDEDETEQFAATMNEIYNSHPSPYLHCVSAWGMARQFHPRVKQRIVAPESAEWIELRDGLLLVRLPKLETSVSEATLSISACEVTNEQFFRFRPSHKQFLQTKFQGEHAAEDAVRYIDAASMFEFCNFLSKEYGLNPCYHRSDIPDVDSPRYRIDFEANGFRLPTTDEWTFANLAGSQQSFFYGDDDRLLPDFANVSGSPRSTPTRKFPPNAFGVFDTLGNVTEACHLGRDEWIQEVQCCGGSMFPLPGDHRGELLVKRSIHKASSTLGFRVVTKSSLKDRQEKDGAR